MIRIRPILVCSALTALLACAEGSKVKPLPPDRPRNYQLINAPVQSPRGELIEATHVVSLSQDQLNTSLQTVLTATKTAAQNGVHVYRVKYQTQMPATPAAAAKPVVASGLIIVPDSKKASYPWLALQHGTIAGKAEAPSVTPREGLFEASQGFMTLVMDYIGYGSSSQLFHPYLIAQAYADAGVDFLAAARKFAELNAIARGPLFLKGYSEGGYATLALQRELETQHADTFPLVASAPSGGPYDLDAVAKDLMQRETAHPVNIPFIILSYTRWLAKGDFNPDAVFGPSADTVATYFTGSFSNSAVSERLPTETRQLLKPSLIDDFLSAEPQSNEAVKLHAYLQEQSLTNKGWQPQTRTLFFHCADDEEVPVIAAQRAREAFPGTNVNVRIIPSPAAGPRYTHVSCPAIFAPTLAFLELLKNTAAR